MTPEQALDVVTQMTANTQATLADHQLCQQALVVLRQTVASRNGQVKDEVDKR